MIAKGLGLYTAIAAIAILRVNAMGDDVTPPELVTFGFTPQTLDTSSGAVDLTVTCRLTDDSSGVSWGLFVFTSPTGAQTIQTSVTAADRISGDANDGIYRTDIAIQPHAERGTWFFSHYALQDADGATVNRYGDGFREHCQNSGYSLEFDVVSSVEPDAAPPEITELSFSPTTIDVGNAPGVITVTARIEDDPAGLAYSAIRFESPAGMLYSEYVVFSSSNRVSGSAANGVYEAELLIPQVSGSHLGTWTLAEIDLQDAANNRQTHSNQMAEVYCQARSLPYTITVESNPTNALPDMPEFDFTPQTMTVSETPAVVSVTARIVCDETIFMFGQIAFERESPAATAYVYPDVGGRISGNNTDGVYVVSLNLPAHDHPANWMVSEIMLSDGFGTTLHLLGDDAVDYCTQRGFPYQIHVLSDTPDTEAPSMSGAGAISPTHVNVDGGPQDVTLSLRMTDDSTGVDYGRFTFTSPSSNMNVTVSLSHRNRTSGNSLLGDYQASMTIPQHAEPGTWRISRIDMRDFAGNAVEEYDQDAVDYFVSRGVAYAFTVGSTTPDGDPPQLVALDITPSTVSPDNAPAGLLLTATVTDDRSGVSQGTLTFGSPSGVLAVEADISESTRQSGDASNAIYQTVLAIGPESIEIGDWIISDILLFDLAGHALQLTGDDAVAYCAGRGLPTKFTIDDSLRLEAFEALAHTLHFRWQSVDGRDYALEYRDSLIGGDWQRVGDPIRATGTITTASFAIDPTQARFYRLALLPLAPP